jgi:hypothetical protein
MTHMPRQPVDMGTLKGFPYPPAMVRHAQRWQSRRAPHATRQWARSLARMLVLGLVGPATSCGEKKYCADGLDIGTTYLVTVLEPANANSQYGVQTSNGPDFGTNIFGAHSCGDGFDLVAGSTFLVRPVARLDLMACYGRIGDVSDVQGAQDLQLLQQVYGPMNASGDLLCTETYEVRKGGCSGQWQLNFYSSHLDSPLNAPVPGQYPPVLLERRFWMTETTDLQSCLLPDSKLTASTSCADYFVVKLEKT